MNDLISRQAAIGILEVGKEILDRVLSDTDVVGHEREKYSWGSKLIEAYINDMKELPPAQPEQRWIPCSERLPERGKDVLVTRDYDGREDSNKSCRYVEVAECFGEDDDISWCSFSDEYKMKPKNHHVIAWMPLPEPYGGDQNG